jgi:hypothetical protein
MDKGPNRRDALVSAILYLEGGGDSKELHTRCREGFRRLLERCGFQGRMPRLVACGGRDSTFRDFALAHTKANGNFVALWIDSEDALANLNEAWAHLKARDDWEQPIGATDEQVLFMTTCMETWLVTDRPALREHYGHKFQESALPPLNDLESKSRQIVQDSLTHASRNCTNAYTKGKRSYEVLALVAPTTLEQHLPSFTRVRRILEAKL